jgi:hypothetical protein
MLTLFDSVSQIEMSLSTFGVLTGQCEVFEVPENTKLVKLEIDYDDKAV